MEHSALVYQLPPINVQSSESLVGILNFYNAIPAVQKCIIKQRYSDFIVKEVGLEGLPADLQLKGCEGEINLGTQATNCENKEETKEKLEEVKDGGISVCEEGFRDFEGLLGKEEGLRFKEYILNLQQGIIRKDEAFLTGEVTDKSIRKSIHTLFKTKIKIFETAMVYIYI